MTLKSAFIRTEKVTLVVVLSIVAVLLLARIALPYVAEDVINKKLANIENYTGQVSDVDLALIIGRFAVEDLTIRKLDGNIPAPLLDVRRAEVTVDWKTLWREGVLAGSVYIENPRIHLVDARDPRNRQTGTEVDWQQKLDELFPFRINRTVVQDGEVHFMNIETEPKVDVFLSDIQLTATNLQNVEAAPGDETPAKMKVNGKAMRESQFELGMDMNLMSKPPVFEFSLKLEEFPLVEIQDLTRAYANLDVKSGLLTVFSEIRSEKNDLKGYIRPVIENLNVLSWQQDVEQQEDTGFILAWEGLSDIVGVILNNPEKERIATDIPVRGTLDEPDIQVLSMIGGLFKNAFVDAYNKRFKKNDVTDDASEG